MILNMAVRVAAENIAKGLDGDDCKEFKRRTHSMEISAGENGLLSPSGLHLSENGTSMLHCRSNAVGKGKPNLTFHRNLKKS